ncbi:MAG: NAD-dependent epimerase/dehydratase family protein [Mangrovicoccus sp.]
MARILVLGAGGRVGRLLRRAWPKTIDGQAFFHARRAETGIHWVTDLYSNIDPPIEFREIDAVCVLAGATRGNATELFANTDLALAGMRLARKLGTPRFFAMSSAAVYGVSSSPHSETEPAKPLGAYGAAKLAMEEALLAELKTGDPAITILRLGNVVGADMLADMARQASVENPLLLDQLPNGYGPARAYIGAVELARVIAQLATIMPQKQYHILNVAQAGPPIAMNALLDGLRDVGHPIPWAWRPAPTSVLASLELDTQELSSLMGPSAFQPASAAQLARDWLMLTGPDL